MEATLKAIGKIALALLFTAALCLTVSEPAEGTTIGQWWLIHFAGLVTMTLTGFALASLSRGADDE